MLLVLAVPTRVRLFTRSNISSALPPILVANNSTMCDDPNGCRALRDIVWSCLSTMFLCTWVSVHPNIPGPYEGWWKVASRRLGIMLAALIAPEVIFTWAIRQRILARQLASQHECHGWTMTHGFFALMGGFMEFEGEREVKTLPPDKLEGYSLSGRGNFPRITEDEIKDKSKGDIISKGLVVLQVGWFVLQCLARWAEDLPITELEVVTIAFAGVSFALIVVWWHKPLDVERAVRVYKKRRADEPSTPENGSLNLEPAVSFWVRFGRQAKGLFTIPAKILHHLRAVGRKPVLEVILSPVVLILDIVIGSSNIIDEEKRIATFYPPWSPHPEIVLGGAIAATTFGALHCVAWQFEFPSHTEQRLWRVASVAITSIPIMVLLLTWHSSLKPKLVHAAGLAVLLPTYVIFRLVLLVLPFLSLRTLSPDIYRSVYWVTLIPHL